jgi:hypothetical protein
MDSNHGSRNRVSTRLYSKADRAVPTRVLACEGGLAEPDADANAAALGPPLSSLTPLAIFRYPSGGLRVPYRPIRSAALPLGGRANSRMLVLIFQFVYDVNRSGRRLPHRPLYVTQM